VTLHRQPTCKATHVPQNSDARTVITAPKDAGLNL